jgi:hypothetical protein
VPLLTIYYQLFPKETSRNLQIFHKLERAPLLTIYYQLFPKKKKFPGISKNVSSWKTHFFPNFTEAGKPIYWNAIQKKEKNFSKKDLTKIKKYDIIKLEKMRKGKCGNGKI